MKVQTNSWITAAVKAFALAVALAAVPAAAQNSGTDMPGYAAIATGMVNGVYYPVGRALCERMMAVPDRPSIHCAAVPTLGSIANLRALKDGEAAFAIIQGDLESGAAGLAVVAGLHQELLTVIAPPDAKRLHLRMLPPGRMETGPQGSGHLVTAVELARTMGWKAPAAQDWNGKDIASSRFCDGGIQAFFMMTGHPAGTVQELLLSCSAGLVALDDFTITRLRQRNPAYRAAAIPAGTYRRQRRSVPTVSRQALLVAKPDLAPAVVTRLLEGIFADFDALQDSHPALQRLTRPQLARPATELPLHPAAENFYIEKRLRSQPRPRSAR